MLHNHHSRERLFSINIVGDGYMTTITRQLDGTYSVSINCRPETISFNTLYEAAKYAEVLHDHETDLEFKRDNFAEFAAMEREQQDFDFAY
jgi:hypothetical protein